MPAPKMTHIELQAAIIQLLAVTAWRHLHIRRTRGRGNAWTTSTNIKGWPDLLLWSPRQPGRFIALEAKVPPDDLSDDQAEMRVELQASGVEWYTVTQDPGRLPIAGRTTGLYDDLPGILRPIPTRPSR